MCVPEAAGVNEFLVVHDGHGSPRNSFVVPLRLNPRLKEARGLLDAWMVGDRLR
jgi:hypothetical protein